MKYFSSFCVIILVLSGCGKKKVDYAAFFVQPGENIKNIVVESINLDTIPIVLPNTSYMGFSDLMDGEIYFADKYFCWVYEFDKDMQLVARHMGQGRGPKEIPIKNFSGYAISQNGNHHFIGSTRDMYIYDSEFNFLDRISFSAKPSSSQSSTPYEEDDFYSLDYDNMIVKTYKNYMYFNVTGGDDMNNISNKSYYSNTRILMEVNAENGEINRTFGRLSPTTKYMSAFWKYQYDIDGDGNFYLSFESDSLIYVYNNKYNIRYSFGHSGVGMNMDYVQLAPGREYGDQYSTERESKGYYSSVRKIGDYLFRTYRTSGEIEFDRMQIYRQKILIGDIEVPSNFTVMGYIAPYYYSNIIVDEHNETLMLYRFNID